MGLVDRFRDTGAERLVAEGNAFEDQGQFIEALRRYDLALRLAPDHALVHLNRGNALLASGDVRGAADAYERAATLDPALAAAHFNLGNTHFRAGRVDAAIECYRKSLELRPDFADAEVALGSAQDLAGHLDDAIASYQRAIAIDPDQAEVHAFLGNALGRAGRAEEAEASYGRTLALRRSHAGALRGLGEVLLAQGKFAAAEAHYRAALTIRPDDETLHNDFGNLLGHLGRFDEALASYAQALALDPRYVDAHSNAGRIHLLRGDVREAIACQRRALAIKPGFAEAHFNLANALRDAGRPDDAIASYRQALAIKPDFAPAAAGLGDVLKDSGQFAEAQASFRRALAIYPGFQEAHSSLLFCLSHDESVDADTLFSEHRRYGERFETPLRGAWPAHRNVRDPERPLRVGFVSGDLRAHPVAYFLEPLLVHLAARDTLVLHAYSNYPDDAVTQRLRPHFAHWNTIAGLPDAQVAELVMGDGIDVLVDLSGHTSHHRLLTFARKPAPIQASWMGYPGTTGLSAMDYYFCDAHFLPLAEFERQFTEKLVHLPASAPFLPEPLAPPVSALPALRNGYLTFGSFNRPSKLQLGVIALWCRLLRAIPSARLLLGAMPQAGAYQPLLNRFVAQGIAPERLEFHARCDMAAYLALHERVDVCLDTFPYSGGTTTSHALWMGVPTLTLAGRTPAGQQGAAILGQVGLTGFVATDANDYLEKGVALGADFRALAELRAGLRARCEDAPNRKAEVIAAGFEHALRLMWRRWCAGLPPEALSTG